MKKGLVGLIIALALAANAQAACTTAVAVAGSGSSTQILASGDLGTGVLRSYLQICNNGPGPASIAIGTTNAATAINGFNLGASECLPSWGQVYASNGVVKNPPQGDVAAIALTAAAANIVACDY